MSSSTEHTRKHGSGGGSGVGVDGGGEEVTSSSSTPTSSKTKKSVQQQQLPLPKVSQSGGAGGGGGGGGSVTSHHHHRKSPDVMGQHSPTPSKTSSVYPPNVSDSEAASSATTTTAVPEGTGGTKKKKSGRRKVRPGDFKALFMPFFKKFWSRLGDGDAKLSNLHPNLYGKPVEEVDPFVFEDTFCLISKKYGKHYIYRFSATKSLFIFGPLNPIRKVAARIIANQLFDLFIILVILCNCVTLALVTNYEIGISGIMYKNEHLEDVLDILELVYLAIYTLEMILKVIAKGFVINKFSYLRNRWNILDFVVVMSGYITIIVTQTQDANSKKNLDFDLLRTFRVLRAIKTISILPGLRMMINALLSSVVQLLEVMALTIFCLMIFALLALELYKGKLRQKCVLIKDGTEHRYMVGNGTRDETELGSILPTDPDADRLWYEWVKDERNWLMRKDGYPISEYVPCGNDSFSRQCGTEGYVCLPNMGDNFDEGWTSFDNFHSSMLSTFQLITLDFWERLYDLILSTTNPFHVFFFMVVIFLGSFYLLNLMLAVVAMSYEEEVQQSTQIPLTKHQKLSLHRSASTFSFEDPRRLNVTVMTQYRKRTPSEREMIARTLRNSSVAKRKPRRAIRRKNNLTVAGSGLKSGSGTSAGTPNIKSAAGSICDENCGGIFVSGTAGHSSFSIGESVEIESQLLTRVSGASPSAATKVVVSSESSTVKSGGGGGGNGPPGEPPKVRIAKISGVMSSGGGGMRVNSCVVNSIESGSGSGGGVNGGGDTTADQDDDESDDERGGSGKKRHNLHAAIMTLLGRRISLDSKGTRRRRRKKSSIECTPPEEVIEEAMSPPSAPACSISPPLSPPCTHYQGLLTTPYDPEQKSESWLSKESGDSSSTAKSFSKSEREGRSSNKRSSRNSRRPCMRFFKVMKNKLTPFVNNWMFETTITGIIIVNTVLMASEHHLQPDWLDHLLSFGNYFFTAVFSFEATLKICALQKDYFRSSWNIFDLFIVSMSIVDSVVDSYDMKISVIRALRLLRVFKLAQSWITMKVLLNIIVSTFGALGNLILVLLIVLYIFAVLGLQYLGEYYTRSAFEAEDDEEEFPRWNFQNFWYAFMMVFRVLCGEWIEPLWDCLKALKPSSSEYKCFVIFLPILVVGNFIVLNLFLALLLNSFDTEELNAQREKELEASGRSDNLKKIVGMLLTRKTKAKKGTMSVDDTVSTVSVPAIESLSGYGSGDAGPTQGRGRARFKSVAMKVILMNRKAVAEKMIEKTNASTKTKAVLVRRHSSFGLGRTDSTSLAEDEASERKVPDACVPKRCWNWNCFCLNRLRQTKCPCWDAARGVAARIVSHPCFEWFILALIFASSITLCFEDIHLEKKPELQEALFYLNTVFTCIFVIEMLLKWFALGLWAYFTTSWTVLDFIIVAISLITLKFDVEYHMTKIQEGSTNGRGVRTPQLAALKALRTLRALRPLRVISRWQGMKIVINALMYAIPSIFNVLLVCLLFWLVFSIMGVQFFKGKFYRCVDNDGGDVLSHDVVASKDQCCNSTHQWSWINQQPNFDNVFQGYLTLFQVATFEGWMEAMRATVDSTEIDKQPVRDSNLWAYLFFVVFIVFGAFFTLNLFIGVIIDNFNRLKKKYEGNLLEVLLTPSQRHYYTAMKKLGRKKPRKVIKRPSNSFLSLFYDISMSRRFEIAIFSMIFLNMVIMGFEHHNQRQIYVHILSGFNSFFTTIYGLEAIVKIIGLRQYYFTVPWNLFDFCLVVASCVDLAVGDLGHSFPIPPTMLRIVRVFRIGRVLRLIKAAKGIRKLLFALVVSLPALFNIGALLALITFIYAILGMALFGRIAKDAAIDEVFNFETFLRSCLVLLRIMTAAGWNDVLKAMTKETPVCGTFRNIKCGEDEDEGECANVALAVAYMVSYLIISYLIVINMYIAIILENFVEANREEEVGIVEDDLEMFYVRWSRYDPQATQFISFDQLSEFLSSLDPPLGIPKPNIVAIVAFNLPIARGNKIHCLDILHALVKHVLGHIDDSEEFRKLQEQMEHKFRKQFPTRKLLDIISSTRVWKMQHNAAVVIQRAWRAYRSRKYPPLDKAKSTQTSGSTGFAGHHRDHHGMFNKMGNLVQQLGHLGHHHHDAKKRRQSVNEAKSRAAAEKSQRESRERERHSDVSESSQGGGGGGGGDGQAPSPLSMIRVDASSGKTHRRALSPSRMSGGSFDVAITFGNQLSVQRTLHSNNSNGHSPLNSCPTTPSSIHGNGESHSVIVEIHRES